MNKNPYKITCFDELAAVGDAFLIDQFGTIHDGHTVYQGAIATLLRLREMGKKIILLSNSGRRAATVEKRLISMGINKNCFDASLCSGEVAWQVLQRMPPDYLRQKCRVYLLSRGNELDVLDGFDIEQVNNSIDADLIMISGSEAERYGYDMLWQSIKPAAKLGIPAICTNPDQVMMVNGKLYPGAGALAKAYENSGGSVRWFGKPYQDIYDAAFALLPGIPKHRIIGIGDSLDHDITGAGQVGCPSILVRTGILAALNEEQITEKMQHYPYRPTATMPIFGF